jgi:hypothetical protein
LGDTTAQNPVSNTLASTTNIGVFRYLSIRWASGRLPMDLRGFLFRLGSGLNLGRDRN